MRGITIIAMLVVALFTTSRVVAQEAQTHHDHHDHHNHHDHGHHDHNHDYTFYPTDGIGGQVPKIRTEWGIGIGGAYTGIYHTSTSDVKLKPRFGFHGHLDFAVCFGRNFAIEAEIVYEGGSIDAATERVEHRVRTRTVDFPLLLSLRMANNIVRITAGPVFTIMSKTEYTHEGEVMLYGPAQPTWNIAGGLAFGIGRNFIIEARYIHALADTTNQFQGVEFSTRPYKITAGVTLVF
ncbi:MAG: PorT family protein [Alistipes sp.]|nr:PorT family protein [Alistipes sp.]